jgi:hypothetical protein
MFHPRIENEDEVFVFGGFFQTSIRYQMLSVAFKFVT